MVGKSFSFACSTQYVTCSQITSCFDPMWLCLSLIFAMKQKGIFILLTVKDDCVFICNALHLESVHSILYRRLCFTESTLILVGNSVKSYTFGLISVSAKALKINKTIGETGLRFNFISSTSATNMAARELWWSLSSRFDLLRHQAH